MGGYIKAQWHDAREGRILIWRLKRAVLTCLLLMNFTEGRGKYHNWHSQGIINNMSVYTDISNKDLITKLKAYFDDGRLFLRYDGKITQTTRLSHDSPWIHQKMAPNRNCGLYHIYYKAFGFIHSICQECWKVVASPRTLTELDLLKTLQKTLDLPSKCGIEKRETVCGLYGGYFYNDRLEEGRACYRIIRSAIDTVISPDVAVILKRGCSEFELEGKFGDSDKWEVSDDQKKLELILSDLMDDNVVKMPQPDHLKDSIFRTWIHWAYASGDLTYLKYTDGKPLFGPYKTYHEVDDGKEKRRKRSSKKGKHSPSGS